MSICSTIKNQRLILNVSAALLLVCLVVNSAQSAVIKAKSCSLSDVKAALASASPGDIVSLPAGSSTWSGPLSIDKSSITIQGNGIGSTIISGSGMLFTTRGETASGLRITGIELRTCKQCIYEYGSGTPRQAIKNFRFDHCKFVNAYIVLETGGGATGVIDHCEFLDTYAARLYGSNDASAKFPVKLGTSDAIFVEDNTVTVTSKGTPPHFIASNSWSKYVVRHNTFNYAKSLWDIIDAHGYCEVSGRGSATWEIYDNTFNLVPTIDRVIHLRGGQGVVYNNDFLNYKPSRAITITDYSYCNPPCVQSCSSYPCKDQINNSFFWNNKINAASTNPVSNCNQVKLDRDYYNAPMTNYTPYEYPHPLTNKLGSIPTTTRDLTSAKSISLSLQPSVNSTMISYSLTESAPVQISIYNVNGTLVKTLLNKTLLSGNHSVKWNTKSISKGVYLMKAKIGNETFSQRITKQ